MVRHVEHVAEQVFGARRRTARLGYLHRDAAQRQTGEERSDRFGFAGRHPFGIGEHRIQIVHKDVPRSGNDRLRTEQVGDHPLGAGGYLGRQIGITRRCHLFRRGGQHAHVGQNHQRRMGFDIEFGAVARHHCARRRITVDRSGRSHAKIGLTVVERREFAQVVDDARPDGDGDGPCAVEHLVDPLHIGPVGMKLLLFNKETLAGNSRLAHGCVDGFAGGFPCIVIGDDDGLPIRKILLKKSRSTVKNTLAEFECFRIGCDF